MGRTILEVEVGNLANPETGIKTPSVDPRLKTHPHLHLEEI